MTHMVIHVDTHANPGVQRYPTAYLHCVGFQQDTQLQILQLILSVKACGLPAGNWFSGLCPYAELPGQNVLSVLYEVRRMNIGIMISGSLFRKAQPSGYNVI